MFVTSVLCSLLDNMVLKWHVFAIAILIGWFELVLLSGRLLQLSVQLETIRAVLFLVVCFTFASVNRLRYFRWAICFTSTTFLDKPSIYFSYLALFC